MKAITLTQPWATLMAIGAKKIETRSWKTSYRGPIAIHAAKGFPRWAKDYVGLPPYSDALEAAGYFDYKALPLGFVIAVGDLTEVKIITEYHCKGLQMGVPEYPESAFGDYTAGRYGWIIDNVRMVNIPQPAKGALGLWEWAG